MFSDGITEAMNLLEEEFGEERLIETIQSNLNLGAKELVEKIIDNVKTHSKNAEQSDDITIMVVKRVQ